VSTQALVQHERPLPHRASLSQPAAHARALQYCPLGHCDEVTQPKHAWTVTSQWGALDEVQSASEVQPGVHACASGSQYVPVGQVAP
jgi:hypothetical protein